MLPVQSLRKSIPLVVRIVRRNDSRNTSFVCTPPRVRVSLPEKMVHGIAIAMGIFAIPIFVATNLKHYRKGD